MKGFRSEMRAGGEGFREKYETSISVRRFEGAKWDELIKSCAKVGIYFYFSICKEEMRWWGARVGKRGLTELFAFAFKTSFAVWSRFDGWAFAQVLVVFLSSVQPPKKFTKLFRRNANKVGEVRPPPHPLQIVELNRAEGPCVRVCLSFTHTYASSYSRRCSKGEGLGGWKLQRNDNPRFSPRNVGNSLVFGYCSYTEYIRVFRMRFCVIQN